MYAFRMILRPFNSCFSVPPKPPVISDANGRRLLDKIGPLREGEQLTAVCTTDGGMDIRF